MVQLTVSGDYVTVTVNGSIQEEVNKTTDAIEYNKYSDGKVSLSIGRRSFEMVDPTDFEIDGDAVTDAADFVTKLTAVFSSGGGGSSYLVYTALLTQSGTDAPVATVLENTLGGTVVWTRDSAGFYNGTLNGAFTANKTILLVGGGIASIGSELNTVSFIWADVDTVTVYSVYADISTPSQQSSDGVVNLTPIEIRVYP